MSTQDNKELIKPWIYFANSGFTGNFNEFIAHNYVGHLGATEMDRTELERLEREFTKAFPDVQHSIDELLAENDRVVLRATARGTHLGPFQGGCTDRLPSRVYGIGGISDSRR